MISSGSVSASEVAKFDQLAKRWWDPRGPMKPLHQMNPARIAWIQGLIQENGVSGGPSPASGTANPAMPIRILDVGCGAGLAAEALANNGYDVLGIDAAGEAIEAARAHADGKGLRLTYRSCLAEDIAAEGLRFPVITALEVIDQDSAARTWELLARLDPPGEAAP